MGNQHQSTPSVGVNGDTFHGTVVVVVVVVVVVEGRNVESRNRVTRY